MYFLNQIFLANRNHVGKIVNGKEKISHPTCRQCPFCEKNFVESTETMKKHTKVCAAKEDITYTFNNGDIIFFQDNFKYMGDFSFTVYFDFETTTCNASFFIQKRMLYPIVRYAHFIRAWISKKQLFLKALNKVQMKFIVSITLIKSTSLFLTEQHFFSLEMLLQLFWSMEKQLL